MATDDGTEEEGFTEDEGDATTLGQVNDRLDRIESALSRLIPASRRESRERVESRLDRPSSVEEQVQAELARRDKERADSEAAEAEKKERADLRETVAKLTEARPAPPIRRATKMLGWGDGR